MKYHFRCPMTPSNFMDWGDTTVWTIEFGRLRKLNKKMTNKVAYTTYEVPAVYHRLIGQLTAEEVHGQLHNSHESHRRQMYARQVLDSFAKEVLKNAARPPGKQIPPASFRSHTLTTILQRQLRGVHDAYMPSVHTALVWKGEASLTISCAMEIYLHQDPTHTYLIPHYHHYLLYIPEPCWYLGVVVNPDQLGNADFCDMVREHHEQIMMAIREEKKDEKGKGKGKEKEKECDEERIIWDSHGMPVLRRAEVKAIVLEGLEGPFAQELSTVVCHPTLPIAIPATDLTATNCRVNSCMR